MTDAPAPEPSAIPAVPPPETSALDPRIAYAFCRFAGGFWTGSTAVRAWGLTAGLGVFLALSTVATVALNHWNRWFFDALERKDVAAVSQAVFSLAAIVGVMAAIGVGVVLTRETLQVRWRQWLIERLLERWLGERRFYHMSASRTEPANPEYRIADDTRWATEPLTDLGIGLVIAVLNATAFISILWSVGGAYTLAIGTRTFTIPAYMVVVALAYGIIMSLLMLWVGRSMPSVVYNKNEREGDFRFALMRLRENAESIALMSGHRGEQAVLGRMFERVVGSWLLLVRRHGHVTWITNTSGPLIPIVPLLFAAPKYLAGDLSLGQVTQLAGAFIAVQGAISWVVDNFNRIAEWYASARRVMDIVDACDGVDKALAGIERSIGYETLAPPGIGLTRVAIEDPFGKPVIGNIQLTAKPGSGTHIAGETSIGKSTLVRAVAGIWTRGAGEIRIPADAHVMIVPQKPYLPLGTLRETLAYPDLGQPPDEEAVTAALDRVGLAALTPDLDREARWDLRLSNGERQRLGIARVLAQRPDVIFLDDALSALDATAQGDLVRAIRTALPKATLISLGQTLPPSGLHDQVVTMTRSGVAATIHIRDREKI